MKILISFFILLGLIACSSSQKNSESGKNKTRTQSKRIKKTLVPGKMADFVQKILPPGWEENYDFERADIGANYMQMTYQRKASVDFYMFSAPKKDFLVRVDWDCKAGNCSEGLSAYKLENGVSEELHFRALLSRKLTKKLSQKVSYCVGPKFQFGSMWAESTCGLGFEFSKTGGEGAVYQAEVAQKEVFQGPKEATMKWNPKTALFE